MIAKTAIILLLSIIAVESSSLSCSSVQGCNGWEWTECAAKVAECVAECGSGGVSSDACKTCLGDSYSKCIGCISLTEVITDQVTMSAKIRVSNTVDCSVSDWMKCSGAAHAAKCSSECEDGLTSRACINFLGSSYVQCGSCFSLVETIKAKESAVKNTTLAINNGAPTAHIESCGPLDVLACAGVVAGCGVVCAAAEIDLPACIACCGGSYSTCKDCF